MQPVCEPAPGTAARGTAGITQAIQTELIKLGILAPRTLNNLLTVAVSDLAAVPDAAHAVVEVGRLLIRRGCGRDHETAYRLSFLVHDLERQLHGGRVRSTLLRGLAQIGLGRVEIGVKNLGRVLSTTGLASLDPRDAAMAHWGLVSAAIGMQDLGLATRFAAQWQDLAEASGLDEELERTRLVRCLLDLLAGRPTDLTEDALPSFADLAPSGWLLRTWRTCAEQGLEPGRSILDAWPAESRGSRQHGCAARLLGLATSDEVAPQEEIPLLLGLDWAAPGVPSPVPAASSLKFVDLCRLRRGDADRARPARLAEHELATLADGYAWWQLGEPLRETEAALKARNPEAGLHSRLGREIGRPVLDLVVRNQLAGSGPMRREGIIVWMTDVKGYSAVSEQVAPELLFETLNPLFRIMNEELEEAGGTLLEFVGDSIFVVFNLFEGPRADELQVLVRTARCLERLRTFGALTRLAGLPEVGIGVGIHKGSAALGSLGGLRRCHVGTLGNTVNVGARLESLTRKLPSAAAVEQSLFADATPDVWTTPALVNFSLRDLGLHPMKNIGRPAHVFGMNTLLPYWVDFVPMGFTADPEPGVVYLDVGNRCMPGIIDHHSAPEQGDCACAVVVRRPELVKDHLAEVSSTGIEFRLHELPDLDCAASYYAACEWLAGEPRAKLLQALADYVGRIDQGYLPRPERCADSLYGVFLAHQALAQQTLGRPLTHLELLVHGLRVIDAALFLAEQADAKADFATIFETRPSWFGAEREWIHKDRLLYQEDLKRSMTYGGVVQGLPAPVVGLWLDHPRSAFFKFWARNDPEATDGRGYPFLAVDWSTTDKRRYVISVEPGTGTDLAGLGEALEFAESHARTRLGCPRPTEPRRYPTDNADPWYFGQGHGYTIVDAPACGTVLTAEEVREIHGQRSRTGPTPPHGAR